jgi:hypothetical protein
MGCHDGIFSERAQFWFAWADDGRPRDADRDECRGPYNETPDARLRVIEFLRRGEYRICILEKV